MRRRAGYAAFILVLMFFLAAPPRLSAQNAASPEALQAATELFNLLSKDTMGQLVSQMTAQAWSPLEARLRAGGKINDATIAELRGEFERIQRKNITELMKDAPAIYARHFTASELRDLVGFYRAPTGQKALRAMPQVASDFQQEMTQRLPTIQKETDDSISKVLRQRGYLK